MKSKIINLLNHHEEDATEVFALDILMGLTSDPKHIPPKYFYDTKGSELFTKITTTKDYYLTACEAEILHKQRQNILQHFSHDHLNIIELGAGDGCKTKLLIEAFLQSNIELSYQPVDISKSAVNDLLQHFETLFPDLQQQGIISEYFQALHWYRNHHEGPSLILFLGSNIGNFNTPQAHCFLKALWNALNPGDYVLMGFDLIKDINVMLNAYNDSEGVTRAFNLNLLQRMNRELDANFALQQFEHFGTYNVRLGAMESYLISKQKQTVDIPFLNKQFEFKLFEPIHVEYSFKYSPEDIDTLAYQTGYQVIEKFYDSRNYFCDALFKVEKNH